MRARVNDWLRSGIGGFVRLAGLGLSGWFRFRLRRFEVTQERLKRKYSGSLDKRNESTDGRFAVTSGSAGDPKRILYTTRRLRACKWIFSDMFARACRAFRIRRTSLYVFSSFEPDDSLTSMLLDEVGLPNYLVTLQAPYRVQRHSAMRALAAEYGATAVRLWLLTISNPGVLYSTNPSTLATFFDDLSHNWSANSELIRNWCKDQKRFNSEVRKIARRLASIGSNERLQAISNSSAPLPVDVWGPAVEAYICWTGGYVKPFLDRVQQYLPSPRHRLIPMYSMSTETVETLAHFDKNDACFLPLATGVVYEFIEQAEQARITTATELEPGKLYEMIVSDAYGLRRYHTADLFLCRRKVNNLPDLVFQRRRGLEYSFTGEKLTAEQVTIVFEQLRQQHPNVFANRYLTCVPVHPPDRLPHYTIFLIGDCQNGHPKPDFRVELQSPPTLTHDSELHDLAARCDQLLSEINCEYHSKRASGRLGAVTLIETDPKQFAERVAHGAWESQFKFLPLCPHLITNGIDRVP